MAVLFTANVSPTWNSGSKLGSLSTCPHWGPGSQKAPPTPSYPTEHRECHSQKDTQPQASSSCSGSPGLPPPPILCSAVSQLLLSCQKHGRPLKDFSKWPGSPNLGKNWMQEQMKSKKEPHLIQRFDLKPC